MDVTFTPVVVLDLISSAKYLSKAKRTRRLEDSFLFLETVEFIAYVDIDARMTYVQLYWFVRLILRHLSWRSTGRRVIDCQCICLSLNVVHEYHEFCLLLYHCYGSLIGIESRSGFRSFSAFMGALSRNTPLLKFADIFSQSTEGPSLNRWEKEEEENCRNWASPSIIGRRSALWPNSMTQEGISTTSTFISSFVTPGTAKSTCTFWLSWWTW